MFSILVLQSALESRAFLIRGLRLIARQATAISSTREVPTMNAEDTKNMTTWDSPIGRDHMTTKVTCENMEIWIRDHPLKLSGQVKLRHWEKCNIYRQTYRATGLAGLVLINRTTFILSTIMAFWNAFILDAKKIASVLCSSNPTTTPAHSPATQIFVMLCLCDRHNLPSTCVDFSFTTSASPPQLHCSYALFK